MSEDIYRALVLHALRVSGANVDPDPVPSRRALAVGRVDGLREVPFERIADQLADADMSPGEQYAELVESLCSDEYWKATDLALRLRDQSDELAGLLRDPEEEGDPHWRIFEASEVIGDILQKMYRRLERESLDDGLNAARFLMRQLDDVDDGDLAWLLGESDEYITSLRVETDRSAPAESPWDEERACLVAQLVYDLRSTAEPRGIIDWFSAPRDDFDGLNPIDMVNRHGAHDVGSRLRRLARLSRGQIAA